MSNTANGSLQVRKLTYAAVCLALALVIAMISGRVVWGIVRLLLAGLAGNGFTWAAFLAGAVTTAVPGIIVQLVLIPVLVYALEKAGLSLNK